MFSTAAATPTIMLGEASRARPRRSDRAAQGGSSAIRDLLDQAKRPGMISLAGGLPDPSLFPVQQLAAIADQRIRSDGQRVLQYGVTTGEPETRDALRRLFGDNIEADCMVVTTGSQQALDLIARVMINPGDVVVTSDPDYLGALQVFRSYGADIHPVAIDADGMNTAQLADDLRLGLRPSCCYVVPNFHNPTGATMGEERRQHLAALSQQYGFVVIEDDPYRELYYHDQAPTESPSDPELTVRLRSTSKTLAPGLRLGALVGPAWLTKPIVEAKQSVDLHTSSLSQAIVADAVSAPWFDAHLSSLRSVYRDKRDVLCAALAATFGEDVDMIAPDGGMFLWARFPGVDDTSAWLQRCLEQGVCFVPGAAFAVQGDLARYARFSFATPSSDELDEAVTRLHACWAVRVGVGT